MKKSFNLIGLVLTVLMVFGVAKADTLGFTAALSGLQEVPPNGSTGFASTLVTVDTVTNMLTVNVTFGGLLSPTVASHIHCCVGPGVNGMVATAVPSFPGFPLGVTSGSFLMSFDLTLASTYNPAFITAHGGTVAQARADFIAGLLAGQTYLNIHTMQFQGGEIRGQLQPVPEPASLLLLSSGIIGTIGALRKRRNRR